MLVTSALLILLCLPPGPLFYRHATGWTCRPPPYSNNVCPTYTCQLLETRNNNRSRRAWPPDDGGDHVAATIGLPHMPTESVVAALSRRLIMAGNTWNMRCSGTTRRLLQALLRQLHSRGNV